MEGDGTTNACEGGGGGGGGVAIIEICDDIGDVITTGDCACVGVGEFLHPMLPPS